MNHVFLAINDAGLIDFVNNVTLTPNLTFFLLNAAASLASFLNFSKSLFAQELMDLFNYYIIHDFVGYNSELQNGTVLKTVQGSDIIITRDGEDIYLNTAKITAADYLTVNGVSHVIDNYGRPKCQEHRANRSSILDRNNITIPPQIPRASASTTNTTSSSSDDSGLSTRANIAIGVAVPVVVLAVLAALGFWFWKKRKASRAEGRQGQVVAGELDANWPAKEMSSNYYKEERELDANETGRREMDGKTHAAAEPPPTDCASRTGCKTLVMAGKMRRINSWVMEMKTDISRR